MKRSAIGLLFQLVCVCLFTFANWKRASAADLPTTPNFVFIFVDDQSWSGTSIAMMPGNELSRTPAFHMPNLERIASQGMIFSQAYASHPKCECSRAALLMGRSTTSLNAVDKNARNWTAPASDSLANTLKRANSSYRAAHFGKWQWPNTPESMGYDASDGITMNEDGDSTDPNDPKQSFGITRRAHAYMEKQVKEGHPFYLQLSYYAPHSKPQALASTLEKYQGISAASEGGGQGGRSRAMMAAMTEDLDTCIGDLVAKLEQLNIVSKTYIIYMSDNGGVTQILKGGKALVDEGGLRVPLIVSGPGVQSGTYCHEPTVGYDILSTVLDFAAPGSDLPQGVEGGSWKPVLMNGGIGKIQRPIDRIVFHHDVEVAHPQTAMRKGNLKLVHFWDTKENFLFDLSTDISEQTNLASAKPAVVAEMLIELKTHVKSGLDKQRFEALESGKLPGRERSKRGTNSSSSPSDNLNLQNDKQFNLPDTGQTAKFTQTFGEDSDFAGVGPTLSDNGDGTVTDKVTGLVWQKVDGGEMTWENAKAYSLGLKLANQHDWRLPTSIELFSIMNHGLHGPALDTVYFPRSDARYWWTDCSRADDPSKIWVVNTGGGIGAHAKSETTSAGGDRPIHVRCVRGKPNSGAGPTLRDNRDGSVTDLRTGLIWQKVPLQESMSWDEALKYCTGLNLAMHSDWRLPNIKELRSVSDDTKVQPSLDKTIFGGIKSDSYWSSTSQSNRPERAWYVDFSTGLVTYADKSKQYFVVAVRDGQSVAGERDKPIPAQQEPKLRNSRGKKE